MKTQMENEDETGRQLLMRYKKGLQMRVMAILRPVLQS